MCIGISKTQMNKKENKSMFRMWFMTYSKKKKKKGCYKCGIMRYKVILQKTIEEKLSQKRKGSL